MEATDANINYAYSRKKGAKSITSLTIKVTDVDEPPIFAQPSYTFQVTEEGDIKKPIGCVSAKDPDKAKREIRYLKTGASLKISSKFERKMTEGQTRQVLDFFHSI